MSSEPELDKVIVTRSDVLVIPFARSAILVATRVGVMQADRIQRAYSQSGASIFFEEDTALRYLDASRP